MSEVSINVNLSVSPEAKRAQINACFAAKRVVSLEVQNRLDEVIELLDDLLDKAVKAEQKENKL